MASLYRVDMADAWFNNQSKGTQNPSREQFEEALEKRFEDPGVEDIVEKFMRLKQKGNIDVYQDRFENLTVRMEKVLPDLLND